MIAPAAVTLLASSDIPVVGGRVSFHIVYSGDTIDSIDVLQKLAQHLTSIGVAHSYLGAIHAHDGAVEWRLEPVLGEPRLEGWIQAFDQRDRASVIAAITHFLEQDLKLNLEVTR
jgi:hypothetical protein